jgi:hypothetical protein
MVSPPMTVVETGEFLKRAKPLMSDEERGEMVAFVCANPEAGEIIPDTGGIRKIRLALAGMGKRGGARVFIISGTSSCRSALRWAKNRKAALTQAERNVMKLLVPQLAAGYLGKD